MDIDLRVQPDHPAFQPKANDRQVAGSHYGGVRFQHWDIVVEHKLNYFEAQVLRYVMRCRRKHGKVDLEKAIHMIEKYIEVYDIMNALDPQSPPLPTGKDVEQVGWSQETAARIDYTVEGYKTDGRELFKCKHCKMEGWGVLAIYSPVQHKVGCPLHPEMRHTGNTPTAQQ